MAGYLYFLLLGLALKNSILLTQCYVRALYGSQNKHRFFPFTTLTDWFYDRYRMCLRVESLCIIQVNVDQPRGLVVRASGYKSRGPGFDSRLYHGAFSLWGEDPRGDRGLGS